MPLTPALEQILSAPRIVLLDLEYTAWPGSLEANWGRPGEHREIVQIGALMLETASMREISYFNQLVHPRVNPVLSDYFTNLTGISNDDVQKQGCTMVAALGAWAEFAGDVPIFSWGDEKPVFEENLRLLGQNSITLPQTTDIRPMILEVAPQARNATSGELATLLGSTLKFRVHNAIEDCRSIAEALRILVDQSNSSGNCENIGEESQGIQ
jgi:inhibitor of KinA sporulation pathway (predicted exonuclease)